MKPIRSRIHALVLAAMPLAQVACFDPPADGTLPSSTTGGVGGSTGTATGTSTTGTSSGGTTCVVGPTSTGSTSGGGCGFTPGALDFVVTSDPHPAADGTVAESVCSGICPSQLPGNPNTSLESCTASALPSCPGGGWAVTCTYLSFCTGRRTEGAPPPETAVRGALQAFLSQSAQLEFGSIAAFDRLARELEAHGAPAALVARARVAQADEVRHTAAMRALLASGPEPTASPALPVRDLESVATENAVEGCVRETYGAAQAQWQHAQAGWPALASALGPIAAEEAAHAELAFAVAAWADTKLDADARARVAAARRNEIRALAEALAAEPDAALCRDAGLPSAAQALGLHAALARELWS